MDPVQSLWQALQALPAGVPGRKTRKLISAGRNKMAQKLGEEAVEVAIEAARGDRDLVVQESADLLYHLVVLWAEMGIEPENVWAEMRRREAMLGIAEKLPKKKRADGPDLDPAAGLPDKTPAGSEL